MEKKGKPENIFFYFKYHRALVYTCTSIQTKAQSPVFHTDHCYIKVNVPVSNPQIYKQANKPTNFGLYGGNVLPKNKFQSLCGLSELYKPLVYIKVCAISSANGKFILEQLEYVAV